MLGDTSTGTTSLVLRFVEGTFRDQVPPTTGAFFITKRLLVDHILCKISIWDTAGQAQFRPLAKMYYSHAAAAILCFSHASRQSWQVVQFWLEELHRNVPAGNIVLCLCACQSDVQPHVVSTKEVQELAAANGAMLVETSAAKNINVKSVFEQVAERVLQFQKKERETGLGKIPVTPGAIAADNMTTITNSSDIHLPMRPTLTTATNHPTSAMVNRYGVVVVDDENKAITQQKQQMYNHSDASSGGGTDASSLHAPMTMTTAKSSGESQ